MSHENIIRAWKDENFRNTLSEKERSLLPEHPSGVVELKDTELGAVAGGVAVSYYQSDCGPNSVECTNLTGCTNRWMCGPDY